jgi:hypothetical protein
MSSNSSEKPHLSTLVRLILSAVAAMANTAVTLPLDVMSKKLLTTHHNDDDDDDDHHQAPKLQQQQNDHSKNSDDTSDEFIIEEGESFYPASEQEEELFLDELSSTVHLQLQLQTQQPPQDEEEKKMEEEEESLQVVVPNTTILLSKPNKSTITCHRHRHRRPPQKEEQDTYQKVLSLWKGLIPSLLLCSNPSIHYTVFDIVKNGILTRRRRRQQLQHQHQHQHQSQHGNQHNNKNYNSNNSMSLSMMDAFLIGLLAKFVATMATYPLIRAKVMLMVTSENSMVAILVRSYKEHGILHGLYKGCDWQLLHTVLSSALMMMVKEQITVGTHRFIVGVGVGVGGGGGGGEDTTPSNFAKNPHDNKKE